MYEANPHPVKLAKLVRVECYDSPFARLIIDGEPFGWVTKDGFHMDTPVSSQATLPSVTLTLVAERVEYVNTIRKSDHAPEEK